MQAMQMGAPLNLTDSGAIKFGVVAGSYENLLLDIPAAIIIGIICGLLGAYFIHFTIWSGAQRKKYLTTERKKVMEAALLAFITASCFYVAVMLYPNNCKEIVGTLGKDLEEEIRFTCPEGQYNPLATLIFNTEGGTIRQFFRYPSIIVDAADDFSASIEIVWNLLIYLGLWYVFFVVTFGVWTPAGVFIPGMIIGCTIGLLDLVAMLSLGFSPL